MKRHETLRKEEIGREVFSKEEIGREVIKEKISQYTLLGNFFPLRKYISFKRTIRW